MPDIVQEIGAYAGLAAVAGLAILSALYFSQARDVKRLREWAGRAPERSETGTTVPGRAAPVTPAAQQAAASPATPPVPAPSPAKPVPAQAAGTGAKPAVATPAAARQAQPVPAGVAAASASAGAAATPAATKAQAEPAVKAEADATAKEAAKPDASAGSTPDGAPAGEPAKANAAGAAPPEAKAPAPAQAAPAETEAPAPPSPGGPATPAAQRPAAASPPRPAPVPPRPASASPPRPASVPPPARPLPQATQVIPPVRGRVAQPRTSARYMVVAVAGVLILGGAVAFGVSQLMSQDDGSAPAERASQDSGDRATPPGDRGDRPQGAAIRPADVTVAVLNGTTVPGLAATLMDQVTAAGFNEGTIANFAPNQQLGESIVQYASGHERDARAVSRRLRIPQREAATPESRELAGDATVIVIAGGDQAP